MSGISQQTRPKPTTAPATRRWTPLHLVLLATTAVAVAIVMGLYAFRTAWYALSGSG